MKKIIKIIIECVISTLVLLLIVFMMKEYKLIAIIGYVALMPFIDLAIKFLVIKEDEPKILGLLFKDFMTPWIP